MENASHLWLNWTAMKSHTIVEMFSAYDISPDKMATILADNIFKCIFLNENNRIQIR